MPVLIASKYNMFERLNMDKNRSIFSKVSRKIRKIRSKNDKLNSIFKKSLTRIQRDIDSNNYEKALKESKIYEDLSKIPNLSLKVDYIFYKISLSAKVDNNFNELISSFYELEKLCPDIKYNSIYLFNKGNLLYDLGEFYSAINAYNDSLVYNSNNDIIIFLKASSYYKLGDFYNALRTYDTISNENKDEVILNNLKNQFSD